MADIFQLSEINMVLEIKGQTFAFVDPLYAEKIALRREMSAHESKMSVMNPEDYAMGWYELNKKMVKMYLPSITDEILSSLGEFALQALIRKIGELSVDAFGAVVKKVEDQKKS